MEKIVVQLRRGSWESVVADCGRHRHKPVVSPPANGRPHGPISSRICGQALRDMRRNVDMKSNIASSDWFFGCRSAFTRPSVGTKNSCRVRSRVDRLAALAESHEGMGELRHEERNLSSYTFERWSEHRSIARYNRHIKGLFGSSILRSLTQPLLSVASIAAVVCLYEDALGRGVLPDFMPSLLMPTAPFDLTSFALALLLVFRTNTSYDRWLEVCTVWSGLSNRARDTMRQMISHLTSESNDDVNPLASAMCRWLVAYCRTLKCAVAEGSDLEHELECILTPEEVAMLMAARHRPSFALSVLTELGAAAPLRESHRIRLDENFTYFEDAVGTCERILTTPIPLSYTRHTSRFMVIWLSFLPFGLYDTCRWATVPMSMVITFLLLGIDEIGVQIEEPFTLLPLDTLCDEVEGDLFCMLKEASSVKSTARYASIAASGVQESVPSSLVGTPMYSPLPQPRSMRGLKLGAQVDAEFHREWEEI